MNEKHVNVSCLQSGERLVHISECALEAMGPDVVLRENCDSFPLVPLLQQSPEILGVTPTVSVMVGRVPQRGGIKEPVPGVQRPPHGLVIVLQRGGAETEGWQLYAIRQARGGNAAKMRTHSRKLQCKSMTLHHRLATLFLNDPNSPFQHYQGTANRNLLYQLLFSC